ncbi:MAG TPA: NADH-quinone oxidoreductase subunit C [Candidatus Methanomethylophilaceae archaeon]|nr:NADH-quinone oxidoreductase subunit C [Candidatus Methanomethylophilaceae archaeon]
MDAEAIYQKPTLNEIKILLNTKFDGKINVLRYEADRIIVELLDKNDVFDICNYISDNLTFEHCSIVMGLDMIEHMEVIYILTNYHTGINIELTAKLPLDDLHVPSIALVWEGANWHERETYELFGIIFDGHPKLERLLTPDTYNFFPFRKSYKLRGQE